MAPSLPGPTVVLAPHPDDAVLSCWHVLSSPDAVEVVTVFAGLPVAGAGLPLGDRLTGALDARERMAQRRAEDALALASAGCSPTQLDLLDEAHRTAPLSAHEVAAALAEPLRDAGVALAPAAIGGHADHRLVREAAQLLARPGVEFRLYADQPYAAVYGWPTFVTGARPDRNLDVDLYWESSLDLPDGPWTAEAHKLDAAAHAAKLAAVRCYATQFSILEAGPHRHLSNPELTGYEVTWKRGEATLPGR